MAWVRGGAYQNTKNEKRLHAAACSSNIDGEAYEFLGIADSTTESKNRVAKAWGVFSNYEKELIDRRNRSQHRWSGAGVGVGMLRGAGGSLI